MCAVERDDHLGGQHVTLGGHVGRRRRRRGTHTYAEDGTYSGSVSFTYMPTIRTCPTGTQTATFSATVQDAPLTATGDDVSGTAGRPVGGAVAHFSDANPSADAGDFSATIAWGDGTTTTGTVGGTTSPTGGFEVSGVHTYAAAGNYPVTTSVTDAGGRTTTTSSTAHISAVPPPPPPAVFPDTIILVGPEGVTSDLTPRFVFTSTVPGSTYQCSLDPGLRAKWTACTSPHTTPRLGAGKHVFEVRAASSAGLTDQTPARRAFEVRPAAATEEHTCVKAAWELPSLAVQIFGGKGDMLCRFVVPCPQWYDCTLSGGLTFSFAIPPAHQGYLYVPQYISAFLSLDENVGKICVPSGGQYEQSGDTYYCSEARKIAIHGRSPDGRYVQDPVVSCSAFTEVGIDPGDWFDSEILGCDAAIHRTWAPGVAHSQPFLQLTRRVGSVFTSSQAAALGTGFTAACPSGGATCAANVVATLTGPVRTRAAPPVAAAARPRPQVVGTAALKIRPGRRVRVTFSLTRGGKALLAKHHRLRVNVAVTSPPRHLGGRDRTIRRTLTIVARRARARGRHA